MNNPLFPICFGICLLVGAVPLCMAEETVPVEAQVDQFFDQYIATYNRRFGQPERDAAFQTEIVEHIHTPLLQAPPTGTPRVLESAEAVGRNFAGFVTMLERKGVQQLQWQDKQIRVLSPTQALANNVGQGIDANGKVVYETVSIYLVYKIEGSWQIISFSPYGIQNRISILEPACVTGS